MSTYASLLADGQEIIGYRNEVNPSLLYLFLPSELKHLKGAEAALARYGESDNFNDEELRTIESYVFNVTVKVLRQRLNILGINSKTVEEVYENCRADRIKELESGRYAYDEKVLEYNKEHAARLRRETFKSWRQQLKDYLEGRISADDQVDDYVRAPMGELRYADDRVMLMAVLDLLSPEQIVSLDVSEMADEGWTKKDILMETEPAERTYYLPNEPPIILTEGVFDRKVLEESILLLHPELADYFKFLDTDFKTEGGAGAVVKMLKSFAAAGISNRILAVFDNDTAAHEALTALKGFRLPIHYKVITYPEIDMAKEYPTLGPQGAVEMNVNGLAGSIELYLGRDCLYQDDASLMPIQWTGYSHKMKAYQGEVTDKSLVQKLFLTKLKTAKDQPQLIQSQDWNDIEKIISTIISELGNTQI